MMLTDKDVARVLEGFEKTHAPFRLSVGGVSIWRLIRFELFMRLRQPGLRQPPIPSTKLIASVLRAGRQYLTAPRSLRYVGKTLSSGLRYSDAGGLVDVYFDHLIDAVPGGAKMSSINTVAFDQRRARRRPVFDDTAVYAMAAVLARLRPRRSVDDFMSLATLVQRHLDLDWATADWLRLKYSLFSWRSSLYRGVLARLGAKAVLVANSGQFSLHAAARTMRIPFIEMQHGIFSADHPDALPIWALDGVDEASLMIPDALTVYGQYHTDLLSETALAAKGVIVPVGAPLIEIGRAQRAAQTTARPVPVVTFTSQGFQREAAVGFLQSFLALAREPVLLKIRLHPGYDGGTSAFEGLARDARVEVQLPNTSPWTHEQIAASDLHVSISSACHHDAIGIGTPTAVLALPSHDVVRDIVEAGLAPLIGTPEQLAAMVDARKWPVSPNGASEHLYRPDFLANIEALLSRLGMGP